MTRWLCAEGHEALEDSREQEEASGWRQAPSVPARASPESSPASQAAPLFSEIPVYWEMVETDLASTVGVGGGVIQTFLGRSGEPVDWEPLRVSSLSRREDCEVGSGAWSGEVWFLSPAGMVP